MTSIPLPTIAISMLLKAMLSPSLATADSLTVALRAQNAILISNQQALLTTVYWSLGIVTTIAFLLTGFGWLVNLRLYDRDKTALEASLKWLLSVFRRRWGAELIAGG